MKKKYKEFAEKFEQLCEEYAPEDFDVNEVVEVCKDVAQIYGE
jgi:hypothetical protein